MYNFFNTDNPNSVECITVGKCSIDPGTIALSEAFIYEARQLVYYLLKLKELGYENRQLVNTVIDTLSSINFGFNYIRSDVEKVLKNLLEKRKEVIEFYRTVCTQKNIDCQFLQSVQPSNDDMNIIKAIMTGERQSIKKNTQFSRCKKNLYEIIVLMAKAAASITAKLDDYEVDSIKEKYEILEFLNTLNFVNVREEKLTRKIMNFSKTGCELNNRLFDTYEKEYGTLNIEDVTFDHHEGKCILVSGDNFKDLELLLEATKDKNINIYTHDKMIWAYAYPHFQKYKHLKGHYQNKYNSFQLDFSKFPGPIMLTRDYSNKVDNVYRGRIYSTDFISGKGITKIHDYDFSPIIECAEHMDGFQKNKQKLKIKIGYNFEQIKSKLKEIISEFESGKYKDIFIVGLVNHGHDSEQFFENLFKKIQPTEFIISLAYDKKADNIYHVDSYFDFSLIYKILKEIKSSDHGKDVSIRMLITQCTNDTVTNIIALKAMGIDKLYISCCNVNTLNPSVLNCIRDKFNVVQISENPDVEITL